MQYFAIKKYRRVALHPEGVDRNLGAFAMQEEGEKVALHPEGVDRNQIRSESNGIYDVALHPEGVDRNLGQRLKYCRKVLGRPPPGGRG